MGLFRYFRLVCLAMLLVLVAGCGSKDSYDKFKPDEEELMDHNYTPRDDGRPLSSDELYAFRTLGVIDQNMSQEETAVVELHFKYFVHERRATFQRFYDRMARFIPHINRMFTEKCIPTDLVAMAMAESGGNPNAISRAGAAGLWQFMPRTGRHYGLQQNSWIDERRDPFKATYAAAEYLIKLFTDFNDWHLAIAAYNAGEGKVGWAIEGAGTNKFFDIVDAGPKLTDKARLRDETVEYVPRIIAFSKILRNFDRLGFVRPPADVAYNLAPVTVPPGTNLSAMARELSLTWDEFSSMNPAYRRTASPPNMETVAYVLPNQTPTATAWLADKASRAYADWKEYKVRKGDSLAAIAKRHTTTVAAIQEANGITKLPKAGAVILIPGKGAAKADPVMPAMRDPAAQPARTMGTYVVQKGDTLFSLAKSWGVSADQIRVANRMGRSNDLAIGQRLSVPGGSQTPPRRHSDSYPGNIPPDAISYTVKPGDTLGGISQTTGVSSSTLCYLNNITPKTTLKIGQKLTLREKESAAKPAPAAPAAQAVKPASSPVASPAVTLAAPAVGKPPVSAPASDNKQPEQKSSGGSVTVKAGDTLYSIARANNTTVDKLLKANNLGKKVILKPGQKLVIPK